MIKNGNKSGGRYQEFISILLVILLAILILLCISGGSPWFGLWDDNQTQWLPIMEEAYSCFFHTGKIPTINWFQMKGMKIYDVGYYGLWNPLMAMSWLLVQALSAVVKTNMITVYLYMMVILGNLSCYGIYRQCGLRRRMAIPCSGILLAASIYFSIGYWYYIFNVYFILPFLIYFILRERGKRSYYCHGAILGFCVLLGNIQYTVYMCLAYALFQVFMELRGEKDSLKKLFTNALAAGLFMSVYLLMLFEVSGRSTDFSGVNDSFYETTVNPALWVLGILFPGKCLGTLKTQAVGNWFQERLPYLGFGDFPEIGSLYLGPLAIGLVLFVIFYGSSRGKREKSEEERNCRMAKASLSTAVIVLLLSFGKVGILAIFMKQIPFLNSFRILAKFLVLLPPLLILPFVMAVRKVASNSRPVWVKVGIIGIMALSAFAGFYQNNQMEYGTRKVDMSLAIARMEKLGFDRENYRIVGFSSFEEIKVDYPDWEPFVSKDRINLEEKISKNAGVLGKVFTIGGYDLAFEHDRYKQNNLFMQTESGYASEFGYSNLVIEDYFFPQYEMYLGQGEEVYHQKLEELKKQLQENAVKYYLFSKDSPRYNQFLDMLQDMGFSIMQEGDFLENTIFVEIGEMDALVQDEYGKKVPLRAEMDQLYFPWNGEEAARLSFTYDPRIRAVFSNGQEEKSLPVLPDESGYLVIDCRAAAGSGEGEVTVFYANTLYTVGKIWTILCVPLFLLCLYGPVPGIKAVPVGWKTEILGHARVGLSKCGIKISTGQVALIVWIAGSIFYCFWFVTVYLRSSFLEPDELWFQNIFRSIHRGVMESPIFLLGHTENYLGYGQIYWMAGSLLNPFFLGVAALFLLLGTYVLMLKDIKILYGKELIPYAGLLWLSMPYAWFTHKIIGPELPALFIAVLGIHLILGKKKSGIGDWMLLGLSTGIKLNYAVFFVFAIFFWLTQKKTEKGKGLLKGLAGFGIGVVLANPIILWDYRAFWVNTKLDGGIALNMLSSVFENRVTEWDGVMNNGIFYGYISWFLLLILLFMFLMKSQSRKYGISLALTIAILIAVCCRSTFLGWYLLPLLYFIPLLLGYTMNGREKKPVLKLLRNRWVLLGVLLVNLLLLLPIQIQEREKDLVRLNQNVTNGQEQGLNEIALLLEEKKG